VARHAWSHELLKAITVVLCVAALTTVVFQRLGKPVPVRVNAASGAVGKTLAQTNLRGVTGASVLAIARGEEGIIVPTAGEILRAGDLLALAGTRDAIAAATEMLETPAPRDG
jgi:CPA2 family monovalent cation:H+ antiporter-2